MPMIIYRCKWCKNELEDKEEAERHAVICGMEFDITPHP
jgi:DNA-directed RNA polymerase subunit RPC12/RpoP